MFITRPELLIGAVTDRIFGPFLASHILHRVGVAPLPDPSRAPSTYDPHSWDDYTLDVTATCAALLAALDEMDGPALTTFWKDHQQGGTAAKLADWRKLAGMAHPVREEDAPDLLFSPAVPVLAAITPWLRGAIFSCPHSQRWREQKFSVRSHLTETNQTEFLKECTMLYEDTLKELRVQQQSGENRRSIHPSKVGSVTVTKESPLVGGGACRNRKQVVMHGAHLQELARLYEGIDGGACGSSRRGAKEMVRVLKERREQEYAYFREQQQEARRKGTTKMTEDAVAEARKEDVRAAVWAQMDISERDFAQKELKRATEARKAANLEKGPGSGLLKKQAADEYQRRKDVMPRLAHGGSLAVTRGEVVDGSLGKKPRKD